MHYRKMLSVCILMVACYIATYSSSSFIGYGRVAEFYVGFFRGWRLHDPFLILLSRETQPVSYSVEAPGVGYYESGDILANDKVIVNLSQSVMVSSYNDQNKGIYVKTSSGKVTVIGQRAKGTLSSLSTCWSLDTFIVNEITDLYIDEYEYFAVSVNGSHYFQYYSSVLIVGTRNNTALKLTVTQPVTTMVGDANATLIPDREYSFVINRLQTIYLSSFDDLTGTRIVTNNPVSIFSGNEIGSIDYSGYPSYLIEQMPPTVLWGNTHYVTLLSNHHLENAIKVLAATECVLNVYCNNDMNFNDSLKSGESIIKILLNNATCEVQSSSKVLVVQFSIGRSYSGSIMTLVPPTMQYLSKILFSTYFSGYHYSDYNSSFWPGIHSINIIVPAQYYQPDLIYLVTKGTNKTLATQEWTPIKVDNTTKAYATSVNISLGMGQIIHTNKAALMSAIVCGFGIFGGYGTSANAFKLILRK